MILAAAQPLAYEFIYMFTGMMLTPLITFTTVIYIRLKYRESGRAAWRRVRWNNWSVLVPFAVFYSLLAAIEWHCDYRVLAVFTACIALVMLVFVAYAIRRARSQWSIKTLLLITFVMAASCGLLNWQGWPMLPILMVLLSLVVLLRTIVLWRRTPRNKPRYQSEDET